MLDYWLDALEGAGIGEVLLNTHHLRDQVRDWIDSANATRSIRVTEAWEPTLLAPPERSTRTGAGRRRGRDRHHLRRQPLHRGRRGGFSPSTVARRPDDHAPLPHALPKQCGIATLDASGLITAFVEKPEHPKATSPTQGLYVVSAEAWREIADMDVFDFGFDVIPRFVGRMKGMPSTATTATSATTTRSPPPMPTHPASSGARA